MGRPMASVASTMLWKIESRDGRDGFIGGLQLRGAVGRIAQGGGGDK